MDKIEKLELDPIFPEHFDMEMKINELVESVNKLIEFVNMVQRLEVIKNE